MAQYYATCQGNRGKASRSGHKNGGATARADGWSIGGKVDMEYNEEEERDEVTIGLTSGSRNGVFASLTAYNREDGTLHAELSDSMLNALDADTLAAQVVKNERLSKVFVAALFTSGRASSG